MGCCSPGAEKNVEKHEAGFIKIKLLIEEISSHLNTEAPKMNPQKEAVSVFINHLNFLINQHLELIHNSINLKAIEGLKSITEEKIEAFSNSLMNLLDFFKSIQEKKWEESSAEFVNSMQEKMFNVQWNLRGLLNQSVVVVFPTTKNQNQALKGIYKKDFPAILGHFQELFDFIGKENKEYEINIIKEFTSIFSCYFWLTNVCSKNDVRPKFKEYTKWTDFKKSFKGFVDETMQMDLQEKDMENLRTKLDILENGWVNYKNWDTFFSKNWTISKKRNDFLQKSAPNNNEENNILLFLTCQNEAKKIEIEISDKYWELNGNRSYFPNGICLQDEGISFGNSNSDQIKIDIDQNLPSQSLFSIHQNYLAPNLDSKTFYIVNYSETNPIKVFLAEKHYVVTSGLRILVDDQFLMEFCSFEVNPSNIDVLQYKTAVPIQYIEQQYNERLFKPEIRLKIQDKQTHKESEFVLNMLASTYKICMEMNSISITTKELEVAQIYAEIHYIAEKKFWVLKKSPPQKNKSIQIYPFSLKLNNENIVFAGQSIENGCTFSFAGNIFTVSYLNPSKTIKS